MIKTAEEFVRLRTSQEPEEYSRAAESEAEVETWKDIILRFPEMREWVAHNKKIPEEIIRILAKDTDARVRYMIAAKNRTPPDVLGELARDRDESIRYRVACNKKAPKQVLEGMLGDEWATIVEKVKKRLGIG